MRHVGTHQLHHHQTRMGSPSWQQEHLDRCRHHCLLAYLGTVPAQQLPCLPHPQLWQQFQARGTLRVELRRGGGSLMSVLRRQLLVKLHRRGSLFEHGRNLQCDMATASDVTLSFAHMLPCIAHTCIPLPNNSGQCLCCALLSKQRHCPMLFGKGMQVCNAWQHVCERTAETPVSNTYTSA